MNFYDHFYPGSQHPEDVEVLVLVLKNFLSRPCRLLEIGVLTGQTARGLKNICEHFDIELEYWGIDVLSPETHNQPRKPFPGAHFVQGDSAESAHLVPDSFDVVISDSCHCLNHVILETHLYGSKVVSGGFIIYHDTNPAIQQTMRDPHGPDVPAFYNSVLAAFTMMNFPFPPWALYEKSLPVPGRKFGGMTAFQKSR
jgi:cephalosporin hydroxylase